MHYNGCVSILCHIFTQFSLFENGYTVKNKTECRLNWLKHVTCAMINNTNQNVKLDCR